MHESTWAFQDLLMFIGGGSASTAGGIKVATLAVLVMAAVAEARGDHDIEAFSRRIPPGVVRLAVAVLLAGLGLVGAGTLTLLAITPYHLDNVLFEVISAFGTVGLSTGITPHLPDGAKYVLTVLMYAGRTGTMTLAAALALRERRRMFRLPEERPIVG
jgi:trk system potassium uptake protein TrkH